MTALTAIVVIVLIVVAGIATLIFLRRRQTEGLRSSFVGAEHARAVEKEGCRRDAEADHPLVMEISRTAHGVRPRQGKRQASAEELRQAKNHYRSLFEELVGKSKVPTQNVVS